MNSAFLVIKKLTAFRKECSVQLHAAAVATLPLVALWTLGGLLMCTVSSQMCLCIKINKP